MGDEYKANQGGDMLIAMIYLDDVVFSGIDENAAEDNTPPFPMGKGWHNYRHSAGRDVLAWGGKPKVIESHRNLVGYLTRILDRMRDGSLATGTLRIEIEDEGIAGKVGGILGGYHADTNEER